MKKKPTPKMRCPKCGHVFVHGEKVENPIAKKPMVYLLIIATVVLTLFYALALIENAL